jgi:hypothetical protein
LEIQIGRFEQPEEFQTSLSGGGVHWRTMWTCAFWKIQSRELSALSHLQRDMGNHGGRETIPSISARLF